MDANGGGLEEEFETFRRTVGASVVVSMPVTQSVEDRTYYGEAMFVGDAARIRALKARVEGTPLSSSWSPSDPSSKDMNRFVLPTQRGLRRTPREMRSLIHTLYAPAGVQDTLRMLVYDGAVFVGWFGGMRAHDAPDFGRRDLALGRAEQDRWKMELVARHRRGRKLLRDSPAHVVIDARGRIVATSPEVAPWLSRHRSQRFAAAASEVRRNGPSTHVVGRYAFCGVELRSDDEGSLVYFNAPLGSFRDVALSVLTPRQREVATLITLGLTANECGEELGIATFTVKQHLAAVYRLAGVSRREELVAIVSARQQAELTTLEVGS